MTTRLLQLLMLLAALCGSASLAAAGVNAWLDRTRIAEGETVQLTLEAQGQVSAQPDTAPLERDFDVLGMSSGSRVTIINGRTDARTSWTITLSPKRQGTLTVPGLRVGGSESDALTLEVSSAPVAQAGDNADILIETELSTRTPYVQGQVLYTVRLLHAVPLRNGQLSEPATDAVLVQQLGEDRNYATTRNGRHYQVVERRYALFPQASGALELPAPVFDGEVPETGRRRANPLSKFFGNDPFFGHDPFDDLLTPARRLRVRGEPARLEVRPRPAAAQGVQWLPAQALELQADWQPASGAVRAGEPLTLQLDITAQGLTGGQLAVAVPASVDGFDVYPDQAQRSTDTREDGVTGHLRQKIAFIPRRAGQLDLPPLAVHWWDTGVDRERTAGVPGRAVTVAAGAASAAVAPAVPAAVPDPAPAPRADTPVSATTVTPAPGRARAPWPWVSALLATGWLLTLLAWWWRARGVRQSAHVAGLPPAERTERATVLRRRFHAACAGGDAGSARRALLEWAAVHWPVDPPRGLQALAERLDDPVARAELAGLERALYRNGGGWDGTRLAASLAQLPRTRTSTARRHAVLAPLYPERAARPPA